MSTIAPSRLNDVSQATDFRTLTQDNFTILAELVAKRIATYQNGTPTAVIGPPTAGAHLLDEYWRDALGAEWVCTSAGTPGMWKQERLAAVTTDPGTGTIPTGYLIRNLTTGLVKRHAGSYAWDVVGAASASTPAHSTLTYAASVAVDLAGDPYRTLTLTGNVALTSSNRAAGRSVAVRIVGDSSSRTLTFSEAWKWIGAAKPTALAANKVAVLSLTAFGPSESDVIAAYAVEP